MENIIVNYLKSPYDLHGETPEWLPSAGMAGYFAGYLGLFAYMRLLDDPKYKGIAVMPIPTYGLGLAINDRLKRAAYPH